MEIKECVEIGGKKHEVDLFERDGRKVKVLTLSFSKIKDIAEIKGLKELTDLRELDLEYNQITEINGLESLVNLHFLNLRFNSIAEIKNLDSLVNLRELCLEHNNITEIKGVSSLKDLRELYLNANRITEIKNLETLANLRELHLHENRITEIRGLESLSNLKVLSLYDNRIKLIKNLEPLVNLREIYLFDNKGLDKVTKRLGTDLLTEDQIIDMLKSMGYTYVREKAKALKKGETSIAAKELIRVGKNGRYHIFVEFSTKKSGNVPSPQVDIHAHYDIIKKKGDKDIHITRHNIRKDLDEMYKIHYVLKKKNYGYMEFKSKNSAHSTFKNIHKPFLLKILSKKYNYDSEGKWKKRTPVSQITFQIVEQRRYSHIVCVYALGEKHDLNLELAQNELNIILEYTNTKIERAKQLRIALKLMVKKLGKKLTQLKEERDLLNNKTQELIQMLKEFDSKISNLSNEKKKGSLYKKRRPIQKELKKNKKTANKAHFKYIKVKKRIKKLKKKMKALKTY